MNFLKKLSLASVLFLISHTPFAQYNKCAGKNRIMERAQSESGDYVERQVATDSYGNAAGNQYDLAVDGAFEGQTIAVLHLYTGEGFDFSKPQQALKEKGFSVYRWLNQAPPIEEFEEALEKSCQLWIISDMTSKLSDEHLEVIKLYFESGRGVYIWGDNQPYYADANAVAEALIGKKMSGNILGDKSVGLQTDSTKTGLVRNHLITTGLETVYEGITIATIEDGKNLTPLLYGSSQNLVAAAYEEDGKRLIIDGGFTRLYVKWETAGTDRYVKNAAAWLVNYERFGDEVVANKEN